ncbi:unnamed protein product [Zymoseptoria tritici ST99CH_1A5]|uniref:Uncharacterized protein n=1 Tax=Zymoseptoria tritici ST99CH_1A5 TaxID=1276529 RepID=A0A1Y6LFF9_ZYMTR|nr:unnamed protein product [Zymoseptoria tritici ST99CH_1A5]
MWVLYYRLTHFPPPRILALKNTAAHNLPQIYTAIDMAAPARLTEAEKLNLPLHGNVAYKRKQLDALLGGKPRTLARVETSITANKDIHNGDDPKKLKYATKDAKLQRWQRRVEKSSRTELITPIFAALKYDPDFVDDFVASTEDDALRRRVPNPHL